MLIFFPCYVLALYVLLKFYFCIFYLMYHFGNVFFVVVLQTLFAYRLPQFIVGWEEESGSQWPLETF